MSLLPRQSVLLRPAALGGAGIGDWFCVTVVRPHPAGPHSAGSGRHVLATPDDATDAVRSLLPDVAARLGADPTALAPWDRDLARFWDADGATPVLGSLAPTHDGSVAVVLLEVNGFEGSRPEVVEALSTGAQVWSLFRGVHSGRFSYAVDGRVLVTFDPGAAQLRDGAAPDTLGAETEAIEEAARGGDSDLATALTIDLLERRSGVRLDDTWWLGEHLLAAVTPVDAGDPDAGLPRALQEAVDEIGRQAAADPDGRVAELVLSTLQDAVRVALHVTGLADDDRHAAPLAQAVAEARLLRKLAVEARPAALAAGGAGGRLAPDPMVRAESAAAQSRLGAVVARLWEDYGPSRPAEPRELDPRWHRLQAGFAATELLAWAVAPADPFAEGHSPADVLLHVRFALADGWATFEDALAAHLEEHLA